MTANLDNYPRSPKKSKRYRVSPYYALIFIPIALLYMYINPKWAWAPNDWFLYFAVLVMAPFYLVGRFLKRIWRRWGG
jgi:hypothetical protein